MNAASKVIAIACALSLASGCAVSRATFEQEKYSLSDTRVCQTWVANKGAADTAFPWAIANEMSRRGLSDSGCERLARQESNSVAAAVIVGAVATALIVAAARKGGGGIYTPPHDWDLIRNQFGQPVWTCRSTMTGQFADLGNCEHLTRSDSRWPGLARLR